MYTDRHSEPVHNKLPNLGFGEYLNPGVNFGLFAEHRASDTDRLIVPEANQSKNSLDNSLSRDASSSPHSLGPHSLGSAGSPARDISSSCPCTVELSLSVMGTMLAIFRGLVSPQCLPQFPLSRSETRCICMPRAHLGPAGLRHCPADEQQRPLAYRAARFVLSTTSVPRSPN
jgi:hypothetical protein